jgi:hypothetical protein
VFVTHHRGAICRHGEALADGSGWRYHADAGAQLTRSRVSEILPSYGMKAICRSLNLNFRIETSRPCTKA